MPDGSRPPAPLPPQLADRASKAFGVARSHPFVWSSVNWLMFLRGDRDVDLVEVANHYALWCFDKAYYTGFNRLTSLYGSGD